MVKWYLNIIGYNDLPSTARSDVGCRNASVIVRTKTKYMSDLEGAEVYESKTNQWHPITQNVSRYPVLMVCGDHNCLIADIINAYNNINN